MSDAYTVRLEPVGVEFEVEEGETVLNAAFRQGIALPHGCKEGQCSACKCILLEGEVDLLKYSTFALNDMERETGRHPAVPVASPTSRHGGRASQLRRGAAGQGDRGQGTTRAGSPSVEQLTHDIRGIEIELDAPIKFWAGQYVDITVTTEKGETITRSFSMANTPERNPKTPLHHQEIPRRKILRRARRRRNRRRRRSHASSDPTAPASGAKTVKEP